MSVQSVDVFSILVMLIFSGCSANTQTEKKAQAVILSDMVDSTMHANNRFTFEDYFADNPTVENIQRPSRNSIHTDIDTAILFDIWATDLDGPHADFAWSAAYFDVADYDGDSRMPFVLDGRNLKVFYNDGIRYGEIVSATNDTMKIHWQEMDEAISYLRWRN